MTVRIYRTDGLLPRVAMSGDGRLEQTLADIMVGWRLAACDGESDADLTVVQGDGGWICSGITYERPLSYRDPVSAACSVIANLFKAHTLADERGLCLHAAGIGTEGGVVLLTGAYRSGKSVVTAACAAAGLRVFSDDIVPLSPDGRTARAPGLAIRMRRPLPDTLSDGTRAFLARHQIAEGKRYLYARPEPDRLAPFGASAPVRAVVALDRREDGAARLSPLPLGTALREAIVRNFARTTSAGHLLDVFDGLVGEIPCLRLEYSRAEEAAEVIATGLDAPLAEQAPSPGRPGAERTEPTVEIDPATVIRQAPGVRVSGCAGELFLVDRDDRTIFNLNETAGAAWTVVAEPTPFGALVDTFAAAFPDRALAEIVADLSALVDRLARRGLVVLDVSGHAPGEAAVA